MDCPTGREPVGYTKRQVRMANIHLAIARHELRELLIELTNHGLALGEQDDRYVTGAGDARVNAATKIANKFNLVPPEDWHD